MSLGVSLCVWARMHSRQSAEGMFWEKKVSYCFERVIGSQALFLSQQTSWGYDSFAYCWQSSHRHRRASLGMKLTLWMVDGKTPSSWWYVESLNQVNLKYPPHTFHNTCSYLFLLFGCWVWVFATSWTAACQAPLSFTISWICSNSHPLSWWCYLTIHLILCRFLLLLLESFPASGSFPMSWFFTSGGQSIGAISGLASVLPVNPQSWFPFELTGWITLQSRGISRVFSRTTIQKHQFFGAQSSLWSNSHPYITTGKTTALTVETLESLCFLVHCLGLS